MRIFEIVCVQIRDAVDCKIPFVIPNGTMEYHAKHPSCDKDILAATGCQLKQTSILWNVLWSGSGK